MNESVNTISGKSSLLQVRLSTILLLVGGIALLAGWFTDRNRISESLRQQELENRMLEDQVAALKEQLSVTYGAAPQSLYWWANADEFLQMLESTSDEQVFLEMVSSLARAEDQVFREAIEKTADALAAKEARTQSRAAITLRFMQHAVPERMSTMTELVIAKLVTSLRSSDNATVHESIAALQSIGPAARDAIPALEALVRDNGGAARSAAIAVDQIGSSDSIRIWLADLVRSRGPGWYEAAFYIAQYWDPATASPLLKQAYEEAETESERSMAIQAMNQIPSTAEQGDEELLRSQGF